LVDVKAFIVTLLIAVVATDVIAKVLSGSLGYEAALSESLAIVVLGGYLALLELLGARGRLGT
jgi:hypothetical protein